MNEIVRYKIVVAVLTETKKCKGTSEMIEYIHFHSGVNNDARASAGVSILVKKNYQGT